MIGYIKSDPETDALVEGLRKEQNRFTVIERLDQIESYLTHMTLALARLQRLERLVGSKLS